MIYIYGSRTPTLLVDINIYGPVEDLEYYDIWMRYRGTLVSN